MLEKIEKIKVGWTIPEDVKESFTDFCAQKGTLAQEDYGPGFDPKNLKTIPANVSADPVRPDITISTIVVQTGTSFRRAFSILLICAHCSSVSLVSCLISEL